MNKVLLLISFSLFQLTCMKAQEGFLSNPEALEKARSCLEHTYTFSFQTASILQQELMDNYPSHPAPFFLEGLIIYWQNFPLTPENPASENFVSMMDKAVNKAAQLIENPLTYREGIFFDLFGRAFKAMYWADNGKTLKVVPDLGNMYTNVIKGFELKDQFVEFYFSCGLYNYYIEAYPDAHPVYKPLVSFMREGDRELGLRQLQYAIDQAVYLRAEALLFMSLVQLNYESDAAEASAYARKLYQSYPGNSYYWGHHITILLHRERYEEVKKLLTSQYIRNSHYKELIVTLAEAFLAENQTSDLEGSLEKYEKSLKMADEFGAFGNLYKAIACMGLSRIALKKGEEVDARKYRRRAEDYTRYNYILQGPMKDSG